MSSQTATTMTTQVAYGAAAYLGVSFLVLILTVWWYKKGNTKSSVPAASSSSDTSRRFPQIVTGFSHINDRTKQGFRKMDDLLAEDGDQWESVFKWMCHYETLCAQEIDKAMN